MPADSRRRRKRAISWRYFNDRQLRSNQTLGILEALY